MSAPAPVPRVESERDGAAPRLRQTAVAFAGHASPRILIPVTVAVGITRIRLGGWSWRDAVIPCVILALEPFTEWVIHVFVLHFRPRTVRGRTIDPFVSRKHRAHHRDPRNLGLVFVPARVLLVSLAAGAAGWWILLPSHRLALTGMAASFAMFSVYEWTHFLIHTPYRPRHRMYRYIWRAHRLHHFRNERYWFGVTMHLADHVLGTFPARDAVPVSATARTLDIDSGPAPAGAA